MIKPSDLRIGNYVTHTSPFQMVYEIEEDTVVLDYRPKTKKLADTGKVEFDDLSKSKGKVFIDDINPIPLLPELLYRCGFELIDKKENLWAILINHDTRTFLSLNPSTGATGFYEDSAVNPIYTIIPKKHKYLHEAQNLYFALTGKELEVNL